MGTGFPCSGGADCVVIGGKKASCLYGPYVTSEEKGLELILNSEVRDYGIKSTYI